MCEIFWLSISENVKTLPNQRLTNPQRFLAFIVLTLIETSSFNSKPKLEVVKNVRAASLEEHTTFFNIAEGKHKNNL